MDDLRCFGVGSVAGMIGKFVEMPFDTVKVRLQSQMPTATTITGMPSAAPEFFTSSLDCLHKTMKQEGFIALYRGIASPMLGAAFETAVLFSIYSRAKNYFIDRNNRTQDNYNRNTRLPLSQICAAGAFTGFFTGVVLTPVELIKCRLQVQRASIPATAGVAASVAGVSGGGAVLYTGAINCLSHTLRHDGVVGLFRGGISTILREVPGTAVWFGAYELTCDFIVDLVSRTSSNSNGRTNPQNTAGPITQIVGGACAGCVYWLLPYPIDTIKTRIQIQTNATSPWAVLKTILREEGIRGLYKGVGFTMVRAIPSSAAMFFTYEQLSALLANWTMPSSSIDFKSS